MCKVPFIVSIILLFSIRADAQNTAHQFHVTVQKYGTAEGLSQHAALSIHRDSLGFIWIGTQNGLNRFDGHHFRVFTKEMEGLFNNQVDFILEDAEGWFWLITTGGKSSKKPRTITLFHPLTFEVKSLTQKFHGAFPIKLANIVEFTSAPDKTLIFTTINNEVVTYHPQSGFTKNQIVDERTIKGLLAGSKEAIWAWATGAVPHLIAFNWRGEILIDSAVGRHMATTSLLEAKDDQLLFIRRDESLMKATTIVLNTAGVMQELGLFFKNVPGNLRQDTDKEMAHSPVWSHYSSSYNTGFFSYETGLFFVNLKKGWVYEITEEYPEMANPTNVLFLDESSFMVTTPFGLFILEIKPALYKQYLHTSPSSPSFLQSRIECRGIAEIAPGEIWVNTYSGTWRLKKDAGFSNGFSVQPHSAGLDKVAHALLKDS